MGHPIKTLIKQADEAIALQDLKKLMDFYADDAILVVKPGVVARGKEQIEPAFHRILEYYRGEMRPSQKEMVILEAGDTALVLAHTMVETPLMTDSPYPAERKATYVFRKNKDGDWLCAIDNSYGTELLLL
ncbi:MAG: SgcJ/EcaC family oxidoreductase [Clostridiales bacterium]|jgi:uncharacterized protein (TIGR02246 family)|nr:SgcJ/EcaC family oxidoreductase [Clostridiales bacterium]